MLTLTPQWIMFDEFWISLRKRNLLFIKLRYAAVALLALLVVGVQFTPQYHIEAVPIAILAGCILLYNIACELIGRRVPPRYAPFHGVHFALLQISADFISLMVLIYLTGGIESPFSILFIFHVILGSLLLPGAVIRLIITVMLAVSFASALLEASNVIAHHAIVGLYPAPIYQNIDHVILHFASLGLALFVSIFLANPISKELYQRERSLMIAYDQLEEAEKAKTKYIMSVVHDLKTPIAAVQTYLDLILDHALGDVNPEISRRLERARVRTADALAMISDILQISRLKLAKGLNISSVNLAELALLVHDEMEEVYSQKHIDFRIDNDLAVNPMIEGDFESLKLVIGNLLSNAAKYTPKPGIVIVRFAEEAKNTVTMSVIDNGIGIPEAELPKVFQDFYRASNSKKLGIEGTGLGTSVISHVVLQHHGTVRVESPSSLQSDGRPGTAFIVTFPLRYVPDVA